ncbi:MAG TPA: pentapeptide repeat-containing protein [Candidatus Dependentiae bacterium]|nr:pentapeptide repeat-containing protein [Candidatus Dependentiae bacterium]
MGNNRVNLLMLCSLSSILLVSNVLQAMSAIVEHNVAELLKTKSCPGCDLRKADLEKADLEKANLEKANLEKAWLEEANLSGANLKKADLSGTNFSGVKLSEADLSGANLTGVMDGDVLMSDEKIIESGATLDEDTILPSGKKYSSPAKK